VTVTEVTRAVPLIMIDTANFDQLCAELRIMRRELPGAQILYLRLEKVEEQ
jgi:hypothetical protein